MKSNNGLGDSLQIPSQSDLVSILDSIVRNVKKTGADEVEAYCEVSRISQVELEKNDLHTANDGLISGIGVRVFKDKAIGFACGNELNETKGKEIGHKAFSLAKKLQSKEYNYLYPYPIDNTNINTPIPGIFDKNSCYFTTEDILQRALQLLVTIKDADPRIRLDSGSFSGNYGIRVIVNSNGVAASEQANAFVWYVVGMAREQKDIGTLSFEYDYAINQKDISVEKTARKFIKKTLGTLGAVKLNRNLTCEVIFTPRAVSELIIPVILFNVSAKSVQKKYSAFSDKIGQQITSSNVTLIDDGSRPGKISSSSFDREGLPHKTLKIIEKGILKSYLYDVISANKDETKSTGHSMGSWQSRPSIGITNVFMEPGTLSKNEMIQNIRDGLIIDGINGDPDPISGDASVRVKSAKIIHDGKIEKPIREATLNINVFKLLKNISISEEREELFSYTLPYIKANDISIISS